MDWMNILVMARKIMRNQDGDLYDPEFSSTMDYIADLELGKNPIFISSHWDTVDKFLNDINQLVYYVSRTDMKNEFKYLREYIEGLRDPCNHYSDNRSQMK